MGSGDTNARDSASDTSTICQTSKSSNETEPRGPTGKLLVELWATGEIVGANASRFKTAIGEAVRLHVPLSTTDYRKLKVNFKDDIWTDLTKKYEFNVGDYAARPFIEKNYSQKLRSWKADLREDFLEKAESIEEARAKRPPNVNPVHWVEFVDYEFQPKVRSRNKKNAEIRALNTIGSTHGRNSFPQIRDKLQKQNPHVKRTRVDDWLYGCEHRDGSILPSAKEKYEQVKEVKQRRMENGGGNTDEEDISRDALAEVFGKEKRNRVRGVGSNTTRKELEHAAVANGLLNQMTTSSIAAIHTDVVKFASKFDTDLSDVKSLLMVLIQQSQGNTVTSNPDVFGKEKKNRVCKEKREKKNRACKGKKSRVRRVGSNTTRKELEHAAVANGLLNQMITSSIAAVHADVAKFTSKFDTDFSDIKSLLVGLIQQSQGNTLILNVEAFKSVNPPRTEVGSSSALHHSPANPSNLTPVFGLLDQRRVTLLDKFGKEVAKGFVDNTAGMVCHGRDIFAGERKVYIDEVLVPDAAVYDGPQDGNSTLNAWLKGGFIVWLDGRLKYE